MITLTDPSGDEMKVRAADIAAILSSSHGIYTRGVRAVILVQGQKFGVQQTMQEVEKLVFSA